MPEKLLIVDDDLETLRLVSLMLQRQGYQIITASNGRQALSLALTEKPDLIILDVMMPEIDGLEVARRLRKSRDTAHIPILMFTAKGQVEDLVAGYEAGADDYLTKPIHPVELSARLKAILGRSKSVKVDTNTVKTPRGYTIGIMAPKGGLGVSTLALNLAISINRFSKEEVIAAELYPGHGTWAIELGYNDADGLSNLLHRKPYEITPATVEEQLTRTVYGPRLLLASNHIKDRELLAATPQLEATVSQLPFLASMVLLDIGPGLSPATDKLLNICQEIILVTEPYPSTINMTKIMMDDLAERGIGKSKLLTLVIINRVRSDIQMAISRVQEILRQPINHVFPPAPEQSYHAAIKNVPFIITQPESLAAQQFEKLAKLALQRIAK
ncbi:MAG TPA: response regulator [Anaerolineaceae bacterium]|nr:response regulator [Anaerolineaceae bacterium]